MTLTRNHYIAMGGVTIVLLLGISIFLLRNRGDVETIDLVPSTTTATSTLPQTTTGTPATGTVSSDERSNEPDSDRDGVSDAKEVELKTDPTKADTDGDGSLDYEEIVMGTNPLDAESHFIDPRPPAQGLVVVSSTEAVEPSASNTVLDSDGDSILDGDETKYGTDPKKPDSDGDGYKDADEIKNGYNPIGTGKCAHATCIIK